MAHPYPVVGLHFTSKPFRLFYAYESATRSPIISRSSLLSPSRSPPLLPSVVLLSLLLFREWISRSVSPFSKRIGYAPVSVERKDFSLFLDLIFFANDGRGSDGFIHCFRSKAKSKFALSNLEGNERYVSSEFTLSSELRQLATVLTDVVRDFFPGVNVSFATVRTATTPLSQSIHRRR